MKLISFVVLFGCSTCVFSQSQIKGTNPCADVAVPAPLDKPQHDKDVALVKATQCIVYLNDQLSAQGLTIAELNAKLQSYSTQQAKGELEKQLAATKPDESKKPETVKH